MKSIITYWISPPTAAQIRAARKHAGLDQAQANEMISPAGKMPRRTWANYEFNEYKSKRTIPLVI
ncbi:hypothetical protein PuT2_14045 [Pusillimonas sp. T2]|nr:hypothetical protein PuT2_14045 [Pusillimonas sp. T2]